MKSKIGFLVLLILVVVTGVFLYQRGVTKASSQEISSASALYVLCVFPILSYIRKGERSIPYVPLMAFIYFFHNGVGIFTNYDLFVFHALSPEAILKAQNLALVGFLSFLISFYGYPGNLVESLVPHLSIPLDTSKTYRLAMRLFIMALITRYLARLYQSPTSGQVNHFFEQLHLISISILFLMQLRGHLRLWGKILLWFVVIPSRFFYILAQGGFGVLSYETAILYFIYLFVRHKIPWLTLVIVLPFLFLIWSARDDFRGLTWAGGRYTHSGILKKSSLYFQLIYERTTNKVTTSGDTALSAYERLAVRTNHLITFVKTVELTPSRIPYWGGYTYSTLVYGLLPRFLFPFKPKKVIGQDFGHRYRFLSSRDLLTSYNLPLLVEMYINFGPAGVVLGMFIFGLVLRALYALVNHPQCGDGGFIIGATLFSSMLNTESDFSLVFGNTFQYAVLYYILIKKFIIPISQESQKLKQS